MNEKKDPLDELIVNENMPVDKTLLADVLKGELTITKDGQVSYSDRFSSYKQWKRVMLYLLSRKVMVIKKIGGLTSEKASADELSKNALLPKSSIGRVLAENLRRIVISEKGKYHIPNYNLVRCKAILDGNQKVPTQIKKKKSKE